MTRLISVKRVEFLTVLIILLSRVQKTISLQHQTLGTQQFVTEEDAVVQDKLLNYACVESQALAVRSIMECASLCSIDSSCFGLSMAKDVTDLDCWLFQQCNHPSGVTSNSATYRYLMKAGFELVKTCQNGATWLEAEDRCDCRWGWSRQYCDVRAKNCTTLADSGYDVEVTFVNLDIHYLEKVNDLPAYCDVRPKGQRSFIVALINKGDHLPWNESFSKMVNTFGYPIDRDYWLGVHKMAWISSHGYLDHEVNIKIQKGSLLYRFLFLATMAVVQSERNFEYTLDVKSENAYADGSNPSDFVPGNCFTDLQGGLIFSAWDNDRDNVDGQNCAASTGNAWWFRDCNPQCNLLGTWIKDGQAAPAGERIQIPGIDLHNLNPDSVEVEWLIKS